MIHVGQRKKTTIAHIPATGVRFEIVNSRLKTVSSKHFLRVSFNNPTFFSINMINK